MIDYATWCAIRDGLAKHLTPSQLADSLGLNVKTVRHWINRPYARRSSMRRPSKLDPFKGHIVGWLDAHPLTAQQVFQRLRDAGYGGGISIVKDYVHTIRPRSREAFLTLAFAPGEAAQVDWGLCRVISLLPRWQGIAHELLGIASPPPHSFLEGLRDGTRTCHSESLDTSARPDRAIGS